MFRLFFAHCAIPRISQIGMAMEKSTYEGIFYDFFTTQRTVSISIYIFSCFSWGLVNEIRFARQIRHMCCMTLFSKGKKKIDFYDVLPIHTILLDIFLPSSTTCRTRPTVANKFTSITRQNNTVMITIPWRK